jgi:hypothetical protein
MPSFTVLAVDGKVRDWQSEHGTMRAYKINLRGQDGTEHTAEWSRKLSSAAPEVGQTLEGEIVQGQYGARFKKTQAGGGGSREYKADPAKQRAIAMEAAQKVAVDILRLAMDQGVWKAPEEKPVGEMAGVVKTIAQSLFSQIEEVAK